MQTQIIRNQQQLKKIAKTIADRINKGAQLIYLSGETGAGKTTLTKAILEQFDINPKKVKSPTYVIKRTHQGKNLKFHHLDLHRLEDINLSELEITENDIYIVEWANKIQSQIPPDISIKLEFIKDKPNQRKATLES